MRRSSANRKRRYERSHRLYESHSLPRPNNLVFQGLRRFSHVPERMANTEWWQRGPVDGVPALLQPVAHILLQVAESVDELVAGLTIAQWNARPAGVASVAFHVRHIAGVIDRLFTYARGESLEGDTQFRCRCARRRRRAGRQRRPRRSRRVACPRRRGHRRVEDDRYRDARRLPRRWSSATSIDGHRVSRPRCGAFDASRRSAFGDRARRARGAPVTTNTSPTRRS